MRTIPFNYSSVKLNHLYPASTIAGKYMSQNMPDSKKVWLLGLADLKEELESHGFECHGLGPAFGDVRFD